MTQHPLKVAREARGWSQAKIAEQLGISTRTVSRWEQGQVFPYPYYREQLCQLFDLSPQQLGLVPENEGTASPSMPLTALSGQAMPMQDPILPVNFGRGGSLVGRADLLVQLKRRLLGGENLAVTALHGLPGVGKTALAVALSLDREVQAHFADGILWAGLGLQPDMQSIQSRWGKLLGLSPDEMQEITRQAAWSQALRLAIGTRRMLLIIDDAWEVEQALALQVGGTHCAHLLTTRFPQVGFAFAQQGVVEVAELSEEAGLALLSRYVPQLIEQYPQEARALVRAVGALPLALTLMGKALAAQALSGQPRRLQQVLAQLQDTQQRLQMQIPISPDEQAPHVSLEVPLSLHSTISLSAQRLSPAAQRALAALAIFPAKPETFLEAAALAVIGGPVELLDELWDSGLLESSGIGRYSLHQTIADYARTLPQDPETGPRLVRYVAGLLQQHQQDYEQIAEETSVILVALNTALHLEMESELMAFTPFLRIRGLYQQSEQILHGAWQIAVQRQDKMRQLNLLRYMAAIMHVTGQYGQAEQYCQQGLQLARELENQAGQAALLIIMGVLAYYYGEYERAVTLYEQAFPLARHADDTDSICVLHTFLGRFVIYRGQGDLELAEAHYQQAQALCHQHGLHERLTLVQAYQGDLAWMRGQYQQAAQCLQDALKLTKQLGHRHSQCKQLVSLGSVYCSHGHFEQAMSYLHDGLVLARQLRNPELICLVLGKQGEILGLQENFPQAISTLQEAVALARQLKLRSYLSGSLAVLGRVMSVQGAYEQARQYCEEGLQLSRQMRSDHHVCAVLAQWGEIHLQHGEYATAIAAFEEFLRYPIAQQLPDYHGQVLYGQARLAALQQNLNEARRLGRQSLAVLHTPGHYRVNEVRAWLNTVPPIFDHNG